MKYFKFLIDGINSIYFILFFSSLTLILACKNKEELYIQKRTSVTLTKTGRFIVETTIIVPHALEYIANSDAIAEIPLQNIYVTKNDSKLAENNYRVLDIELDSIFHSLKKFLYISVRPMKTDGFKTDTIKIHYEFQPFDTTYPGGWRLFSEFKVNLAEIKFMGITSLKVNSQLVIRSEDSTYIPYPTKYDNWKVKTPKNWYEIEFEWISPNSGGTDSVTIETYPWIWFRHSNIITIGDVKRSIDLTDLDIVKETIISHYRATEKQKNLVINYPTLSSVVNPTISGNVEINGEVNHFFPSDIFVTESNRDSTIPQVFYYYGLFKDSGRVGERYPGIKIIQLGFPINGSEAKVTLHIEYDSKILLSKIDAFSYMFKLEVMHMGEPMNADIIEVKIPDKYHYSSYTKEKHLDISGKNLLRYSNLSMEPNYDIPIELSFSRNGIEIYCFIKWFNIFVFLVAVSKIIFLFFKRRKIMTDQFMLVGMGILGTYLQICIGFIDADLFIDAFIYTNSFLYIMFFILIGILIFIQYLINSRKKVFN